MPLTPKTGATKEELTKERVERIAGDAANTTAIAEAKSIATSKYTKPSSGIPASDLSSGVQASLGKADTAIQEHQSLSGYATEEWVEEQGYLTEHQSLSGYVQKSVTSGLLKNDGTVDTNTYLTEHQDITGKVDKTALFDNPDTTPKVKSALLPSYVDDVLEYSSISAFPATGESGKIYVALDTNKTYRWTGTQYTEIAKGAEVVAPSTSASDAGKAADAKATGEQLAGKASTADATLSQGYTEWVCSPATSAYDETYFVAWSLMPDTDIYAWCLFAGFPGDADLVSVGTETVDAISFETLGRAEETVTATRTASGYTLGPDNPSNPNYDKPLAPAGDYALKSEIPSVPVKQVKRNGTALTPDANGAVDVTVPTTAADVGAANQTAIAAAFTAKAYAVGDLATYNGALYRCKSAYTATASSAKPNADTTHWGAAVVSVLLVGKANDGAVVHTEGAETVAGEKNFFDFKVSHPQGVGYIRIYAQANENLRIEFFDAASGLARNLSLPVLPYMVSDGCLAVVENVAPTFYSLYGQGVEFDLNQLVSHNGVLYRCILGYTYSSEGYPPDDSTHWTTATVEDALAAIRASIGGKLDASARNLLPYASTTTIAPEETAVYRSALNADGTFPTITDPAIPTASAYYQFELELTVPSTVPSTITGPSGWVFLDGHGLPDPADLSGGETIYISVRLDCTARTFLASVWRVA